MTTTPPPELQRLLEAAFHQHQRGDFSAAEAGYRRVLAASPDQPDANHLLGVLLDQTGRGEAGAALIRRSLAGAPDNPDAHCNLGRVLAGLGRLEEAIASYESALARRPDFPQAHFNLGVALRRLGRLDAAIDCYRALVRRHPGHGGALLNLGNALKAAGRPQEATDCWRRALAAEPGLTAARVNLANAARDAGDPAGAEQGLIAAIRQAPDHAEACMSLALLLRGRIPGPGTEPAAARAALLACLARDDLEHQDLATAATAVLLAGAPPVVTEGWGEADPAARRAAAAQAPIAAFLSDPLLHRLLTRTILMDAALEAFLVGLRSAFLDAAGNEVAAGLLERETHWLVPLALQCFRNEYVYPETGTEAASVEALTKSLLADLADGAAVDARLAMLGCYRPLRGLSDAETLIGRSGPAWWPVLARTQVEEPRTERRLGAALPRLAGESRPVSEAVRRQYEENPYPRWTGLYRSRPSPFLECLRRQVPSAPLEDAPPVPAPRVLVAGCGTGLHAISSALEYEGARVLAVDLSLSSLAFAQRRAAELGVTNIEFLQADLLDLGRLERRFDVIESVGVLHHLADPSAGGRVLRGLLAPGGYMKLGLYSELARGAVVAARRLIAERGDPPTPAGIRAARAAILRLPADAPAAGVAASGDFYSTSGVRDLLFHVQERRFTLPEVAALVDRLELEFLGFVLDDWVLRDYRQAEPDDPEARSLERWSRYEATHPETFGEMYQFWLRAPSEPA